MKRPAVTFALTLGLAAASAATLAQPTLGREAEPGSTVNDGPADVERGVATLRVISHIEGTCQIWVNGSLRATIGSFGDSGVLSTAPFSTDRVTEIVARCDNAIYQRTMKEVHTHCDFAIDPAEGDARLTVEQCM